MDKIKVYWKIHGQKEFIENMDNLGRCFGKNSLERAAIKGGRVISFEAERRAPKKTGKAAKTIRARITDSKPGEVTVVIGPDSKGWYLMFSEFGTSHQPARPFLRPALEDKQYEAMQVMADDYAKIISRSLRRAKK